MSELIRKITVKNKKAPAQIEAFRPGDTVNVHVKVKEGEKERVQVYKGIVTRIQGAGASRTFTVRKVSSGVGVERIFPFLSPALDRVELVSHGKVRKARLYYLRGLEGKAAAIESELATTRKSREKAEAAKA